MQREERVKAAIFNSTFNVSTLGLEIAALTRSIGTENRIFKRSTMKNTMFHVVIL